MTDIISLRILFVIELVNVLEQYVPWLYSLVLKIGPAMVGKRNHTEHAAIVEGDEDEIGAILATGSPVRTPSMNSDIDELESLTSTQSALSLVRLCFTRVCFWNIKINK